MRNLVLALLVVGLLAAPSLGVVNVKITADGPVVAGQVQLVQGTSTTVRIWAQGTAAGVYSLGGYIVPTSVSGAPDVLTSTGIMAFDPLFLGAGLLPGRPGTPDTNGLKGGYGDALPATGALTSGFGTVQTGWATPDALLGKAAFVEIGHYTVVAEASPALGVVSLGFVSKSVGGFKPLETDKTGLLGTLTPVAINVIPEPVTMALLARRRR